jgi:hypothetical protein
VQILDWYLIIVEILRESFICLHDAKDGPDEVMESLGKPLSSLGADLVRLDIKFTRDYCELGDVRMNNKS